MNETNTPQATPDRSEKWTGEDPFDAISQIQESRDERNIRNLGITKEDYHAQVKDKADKREAEEKYQRQDKRDNFLTIAASAALATGAAIAIAGPAVSNEIQNSLTEDHIVAADTFYVESDGIYAAAEKAANELALEAKIDPSVINIEQLHEQAANAEKFSKQLTGDTELQAGNSFYITLIDKGATYDVTIDQSQVSTPVE